MCPVCGFGFAFVTLAADSDSLRFSTNGSVHRCQLVGALADSEATLRKSQRKEFKFVNLSIGMFVQSFVKPSGQIK